MAEKPKTDYLFETSWEVCNKVGGINTVLKSKAAQMCDRYKRYVLIGPYFKEKAQLEFKEEEAPKEFAEALKELKKKGLICHYGRWQIKGEPETILIEFLSLAGEKNRLKGELWDSYQIDSLGAGWDFEEQVVFSGAVAQLLRAIEKGVAGKKIVGHFHEWMTGAALLFLKNMQSSIKTVFTTHATMLGRALSGSGAQLYEILPSLDPVAEAYHHGVQAKHLTERACAEHCSVFTTVSEITGMEAEKILGRKPEVLVLNGLDLSRFPTFEETSMKHIYCREKLRTFLAFYFFPYYTFPLEHNLSFFVTSRYEYKNKGMDLIVESLGRLNEELKKNNDDPRTVSMFFWVPMNQHSVRTEIVESKNYYHHIKGYIDYNADEILKKVLHDCMAEGEVNTSTLFTKEFLAEMKKDLIHFRREGNPPITTHHLVNEATDELVQALYKYGLDNKEDDPVKVIVMPVYLDGNDGLINLPYYDAIAGTHLGLFPSYYEPWGYTPLETAGMGVSSVTSDLAGFGRFVEEHLEKENPGMHIIHRLDHSWEESVSEFTKVLKEYVDLNHSDRVKNKIAAKKLTQLCDWEQFVENYIKAHNLALKK